MGDSTPARPAQLQLHGAQIAPIAPAAPVTDVAVGRPTAVSPLRKAFDSMAARSVQGDVRLLEHNTESWLSMWTALSNATTGVDASYFIFQRDIFGMAYLGQLLRIANEGQPVRLMLDSAGDAFGRKGFTLSLKGQDYLQELMAAKTADVRVYHPLHKKALTALKGNPRPFAALANNHDKLLRTKDYVVTGGRNISKDYFTAPEDRADVYRDTDMLIRGERATGAFKASFDAEWSQDELHFKAYSDTFGNIVRRDLELVAASVMMDVWLHAAAPSPKEQDRLRTDTKYRNQVAEGLLEEALAKLPEHGIERSANVWDKRNLRKLARELAGYTQLRGAANDFRIDEGLHPNQEIKVLDRASAAVQSEDDLSAALGELSEGARHRILIQNPYVVLTAKALAALEAAGKRGVQIDLLTNSPESTDSLMTQAFFLEDWPRILARVPNCRIFVLTGEQKLHAKSASADDQVTLVSTYNLDLISEQINGELGAATWSPELAADLRQSFEADRANPKLRVVEYTIQRDAKGQPVLVDGNPVVTFGPHDHMGTWNKIKYGLLTFLIRHARKLPALSDIGGIELPQGKGK